jgi:hypothetical protein
LRVRSSFLVAILRQACSYPFRRGVIQTASLYRPGINQNIYSY